METAFGCKFFCKLKYVSQPLFMQFINWNGKGLNNKSNRRELAVDISPP